MSRTRSGTVPRRHGPAGRRGHRRSEDWVRGPAALRSFRRSDFAGLAAARARGEDPVVLDVRRDSEHRGGAITGAVHIALHELRRRLGEVPPGVVWVHCAGGMRAAIAASLLDAAGREVVAVDDGFDAAAQAGLSLTGPSPAA